MGPATRSQNPSQGVSKWSQSTEPMESKNMHIGSIWAPFWLLLGHCSTIDFGCTWLHWASVVSPTAPLGPSISSTCLLPERCFGYELPYVNHWMGHMCQPRQRTTLNSFISMKVLLLLKGGGGKGAVLATSNKSNVFNHEVNTVSAMLILWLSSKQSKISWWKNSMWPMSKMRHSCKKWLTCWRHLSRKQSLILVLLMWCQCEGCSFPIVNDLCLGLLFSCPV